MSITDPTDNLDPSVCVFGTIRAVSITKTTIAEHDFSCERPGLL